LAPTLTTHGEAVFTEATAPILPVFMIRTIPMEVQWEVVDLEPILGA
jgi:hypothetical protein